MEQTLLNAYMHAVAHGHIEVAAALAKQMTGPVKPTKKTVAKTVAKPTTELVAKPATELVAKPATELVAKPATELVAKPATELVKWAKMAAKLPQTKSMEKKLSLRPNDLLLVLTEEMVKCLQQIADHIQDGNIKVSGKELYLVVNGLNPNQPLFGKGKINMISFLKQNSMYVKYMAEYAAWEKTAQRKQAAKMRTVTSTAKQTTPATAGGWATVGNTNHGDETHYNGTQLNTVYCDGRRPMGKILASECVKELSIGAVRLFGNGIAEYVTDNEVMGIRFNVTYHEDTIYFTVGHGFKATPKIYKAFQEGVKWATNPHNSQKSW